MKVGPVDNVRVSDINMTALERQLRRDRIGSISVEVRRRHRFMRDLVVSAYIKNEQELISFLEPLEELSENINMQPIRVLVDEYGTHLNGFYWLQNVDRDTVARTVYVEEYSFELVYVGNPQTHKTGYLLQSLSQVTNDWGI